MLFNGDVVSLEEAAGMGLVDDVIDGDIVEGAVDFAAGMVANAPISIAGMKLILRSIMAGETERDAAAIEDMIARSMDSDDGAEGARAFTEKRAPRFTGT
jgi:enoyl-CoA hydratase/carnithine racemase